MMKLINFKISDDNIAIDLDGQGYLDLHNNFLLDELKYTFEKRHFELLFIKSNGNWVKEYPFNSFKIVFSEVQVLRMKEIDQADTSLYREDDKTISQIGYTPKGELEYRGVLVTDYNQQETENAICFYTQNDQVIIVYGEEARVELSA